MPKRGTETVEIRRAPTKDRFGDIVPGAKVGDLKNCIVWPRSSSENSDRGIISIDGHHVWAPDPVDFDFSAEDVAVVRGNEEQVEGTPGDWRKASGTKLGILFETKRYGT
jgi:uncharacterized protein YfaP (DUF2135 family)